MASLDKSTPAWDRDLKNFIIYSNQKWRARYPRFRANYQGDKMIGYKISEKHVDIPKQYLFLRLSKPDDLTLEHLGNIPAQAFVIKDTLGHQGNKVVCAYKCEDGTYLDLMRSRVSPMTLEELRTYIFRQVCRWRRGQKRRPVRVIFEEFLQESIQDEVIPIDYKVYVIGGRARVVNLYYRRPNGKFMACFTRNWQRIPLKDFYVNPRGLGYVDLDVKNPEHPALELPSMQIRERLLQNAERLAQVHKALFARYDFYCLGERIVLGEITPLCGGLRGHALTRHILGILFPWEWRRRFRAVWNRPNPKWRSPSKHRIRNLNTIYRNQKSSRR